MLSMKIAYKLTYIPKGIDINTTLIKSQQERGDKHIDKLSM